ncbi:SRPBCC family protein [Streptomyces sp. NPDC046805]|uniref:SRPBCC family protein n=1 Tax=Streptomyces sp. NPDC046805 TaxID=3155134 RepID=UPI0033E4F867
MAIRHQLVEREPAAVWNVLRDPSRYADWVVGTSESAPRTGRWPEVGSSLAYTVKLGPKSVEGYTVVRRLEHPRYLELEAHTSLGTARIAFDIRPWGEETLLIVDEHPLRGLGGTLHNTVLETAIQFRHRDMLRRLARLVERLNPPTEPGSADARPSSVTGEAGRE